MIIWIHYSFYHGHMHCLQSYAHSLYSEVIAKYKIEHKLIIIIANTSIASTMDQVLFQPLHI